VVDMGPGAGRKGGEVVYQGSYAGLLASGTLTGNHMRRHQKVKEKVRKPQGQILIEGASMYNLRDVSVSIPKGVLTVVTGVAGSGKSTLIQRWLPKRFPDAVVIDQSLSRGSKRSNTATYTGILDPIRKAFASANKVEASMFSANSKGACPECGGIGVIYTDLAHLDPIATTCEACQGKRFTEEVLRYTLRGKNISEVFALSVVDAAAFFTEKPVLKVLKALEDVGLGYVTLGQPLNTLSGGEKQRLKLAIEFNNQAGITILDEPTTGLHMNDVDTLIGLFDRLVDGGSTVIVIEHDLDVIARADWILDMGPGAGNDGGQVVFEGPPSELVKCEASLTGRYLAMRNP
ncbi:ATP-binding cassette domain-containing protein, partial [bacterium]